MRGQRNFSGRLLLMGSNWGQIVTHGHDFCRDAGGRGCCSSLVLLRNSKISSQFVHLAPATCILMMRYPTCTTFAFDFGVSFLGVPGNLNDNEDGNGNDIDFDAHSVSSTSSRGTTSSMSFEQISKIYQTQRVHVAIWYILGPSSRYIGNPLGPQVYTIYLHGPFGKVVHLSREHLLGGNIKEITRNLLSQHKNFKLAGLPLWVSTIKFKLF